MFTGIVTGIGTVQKIDVRKTSHRVRFKTTLGLADAKKGESISVDGCCLTMVTFTPKSFTVDIALESLKVTTLGELREGDRINLERSLKASDRLGGHWVQGHVDAVGTLIKKTPYPEGEAWTIRFPKRLHKYMVKKGSIAVDGVSLTLNEVRANSFEVFLIPHTLEETNFCLKTVGSKFNLEVDILGKYIETLIQR